MKILHVITTLERGGAENQLNLLVKMQASHGHIVQIAYLKGREELAENLNKNNVSILRLLTGRNFLIQVVKLKFYLRKNQFDVIHAHLPQAEMVVRFSSNKKSKIFVTRHFGGQFHPKLPLKISSFLGRIASKKAIYVIAISRSVKKILIENGETYNPNLIKVIYYGFSADEFFDGSTGAQFNLKKNNSSIFTIGCVSRLSPEKDLVTVLKAFHEAKKKIRKLHLYLAGEGAEKKKLMELTVELGIENEVTFLGKISNVASFLQNVDLLVLSSKFEGFGMVLLEAMATHTRIVAAMNSGIEEVIGNNGAGMFFETSNYEDLSSKIYLSSTKIGSEFVAKQNIQLQIFSAEKMFNEIERIYQT
jgi:glycosyltransferase involved in cell wall biosynthesis